MSSPTPDNQQPPQNPAQPEPKTWESPAPPPGEEITIDDVDTLHELLLHQRQNHAVEVGVLEKRTKHAVQEAKRAREREDLAKWELERIRHATRGEIRHHAGRIADLLSRNERLEALLALPWWALIRRWKLRRALGAIS